MSKRYIPKGWRSETFPFAHPQSQLDYDDDVRDLLKEDYLDVPVKSNGLGITLHQVLDSLERGPITLGELGKVVGFSVVTPTGTGEFIACVASMMKDGIFVDAKGRQPRQKVERVDIAARLAARKAAKLAAEATEA